MKNLICILILVFATTFTAQTQMKRSARNSKMTTEQQAILKVKKMTLALDLNATQQKELSALISQQVEAKKATFKARKAMKEANKKPTSDEVFTMQNKRLDAQIVMKNKMRKILTPAQYKKFKKMAKGKKRMAGKQMKHQKGKREKKRGSRK
jgi:hypothetical protein